MGLFEKLTSKAKQNRQRIVLPEGTEPRTLTAADRLIVEELADIILIGNPAEIKAAAAELGLTNISKAKFVNYGGCIQNCRESVVSWLPDD